MFHYYSEYGPISQTFHPSNNTCKCTSHNNIITPDTPPWVLNSITCTLNLQTVGLLTRPIKVVCGLFLTKHGTHYQGVKEIGPIYLVLPAGEALLVFSTVGASASTVTFSLWTSELYGTVTPQLVDLLCSRKVTKSLKYAWHVPQINVSEATCGVAIFTYLIALHKSIHMTYNVEYIGIYSYHSIETCI